MYSCRGIFSNLGEFKKFLDDTKPHLVRLTETWLKPNNRTINFKGYEILRCDRVNGLGGGIALLISRESSANYRLSYWLALRVICLLMNYIIIATFLLVT